MSRESAPDPGSADAPVPPPKERSIDTVPDEVRAAARRAFAARDRRADVLGLLTDSLVDATPTGNGPRRLSFAGADLPGQVLLTVLDAVEEGCATFVVECPWDDAVLDRVECDGEIAPVTLQAPGRWLAGPVRHGLMRAELRLREQVLHTAWLRV
jgi:hypothetical protein